MTARAERRAIAGLFAIFALLIQAFAPMAAFAGPQGAGGVLCVAHGVQTGPTDHAPAKGTPAHGCEHGCCPASVTASPPDAVPLAEAVAYVAAAPSLEPRTELAPGRGLAAPPPPSQGPPRFSA